jgi:hypothetical protein
MADIYIGDIFRAAAEDSHDRPWPKSFLASIFAFPLVAPRLGGPRLVIAAPVVDSAISYTVDIHVCETSSLGAGIGLCFKQSPDVICVLAGA